MKIVLHQANFRSLFGLICSFYTRSQWSHASIVTDESWWDTTFARGYFDLRKVEPNRKVLVFDLPDISGEALCRAKRRTKYDRAGLLLYPFDLHTEGREFCYETAIDLLRANGIKVAPGRASPKKILDALEGYHFRYCKEGEVHGF